MRRVEHMEPTLGFTRSQLLPALPGHGWGAAAAAGRSSPAAGAALCSSHLSSLPWGSPYPWAHAARTRRMGVWSSSFMV